MNLKVGVEVFTLELHTIVGDIASLPERKYVRDVIFEEYFSTKASAPQRLGFIDDLHARLAGAEATVIDQAKQLTTLQIQMEALREGSNRVVLFGVFLVSATLFGAIIAVLIGFLRETPALGASPVIPAWISGILIPVVLLVMIFAVIAGLVFVVRRIIRSIGN